jgi:putative ABC transport system permease protein
MKSDKIRPPRLAFWFLSRSPVKEDREGLSGDAEEVFRQIAQSQGRLKANLWVWGQIVISLPSFINYTTYWSRIMFKNILKTAWRAFMKQKGYSLVNILGLVLGLTAAITIILFAEYDLTYDRNHKNAKSIYLVYKERLIPTGTQITLDTWFPMAAAFKSEYMAVQNATHYWDDTFWVEYQDLKFEETVTISDKNLFAMFTLPFIHGDPGTAYDEKYSVVISDRIAEKYFGNQEPLGKVLRIDFNREYTVTGVLAPIPENSTIQIDFVLPSSSISNYDRLMTYWGSSWLNTFVQLVDGTVPAQLESEFPAFVKKTWNEEERARLNLKLMPLLDYHNETTHANTYAYILLGAAAVILLIACINFTNLATARSLERGREIGIRKVLGSNARLIRGQFLMESVLVSMVALGLGLFFTKLLLPVFNNFYQRDLSLDFPDRPWILLGFVGLGIMVGVLSGAYPAFVLARIPSVEALKERIKTSTRGIRMRNVLLISQFSLAIFLIIGTAVMWKQNRYMKEADLNFQKDNVLIVSAEVSDYADQELGRTRLESFKRELRAYSGVTSVASSTHVPGRWPGSFTFVYPTDRDESLRLRQRYAEVDDHFFATYGIEFVQGRNFSPKRMTDQEESVILNEAAMRDIGWEDITGKQIRFGSQVMNVVGVVEDYHYISLQSEVEPVVHFFRNGNDEDHRFISIKITSGDPTETVAFIQNKWKEMDPNMPFDYFFADENFGRLYLTQDRLATVTSFFALIAILISCLGLFSLTSLVVTQRTKEIGIRKVLGASVSRLVVLLSREFAIFVLIAFFIAAPSAYFFMHRWLQNFATRTPLTIDVFAGAGVLALLVALMAVGSRAILAAVMDPVKTLRYE